MITKHPIEGLDQFVATMKAEGARLGPEMEELRHAYYDAEYVYRQMAAALDEPEWLTHAETARSLYREYLLRHDHGVAGWMRFPHGRLLDWQTNQSESAHMDLIGLRDNGAYSSPGEWSWAEDVGLSREIAYNLEAHICAERAGQPRDHERVDALVGFIKKHLDQWITQDYYATSEDRQFLQSFMAGLSCRALADYHYHSKEPVDPGVVDLVVAMCDYLWEYHWAPAEGTEWSAFRHVVPATEGTGSTDPAPDLIHLNSLPYAWCYLATGEPRHLARYDEIFASAAALKTQFWTHKQFQQFHRDVFVGLKYRDRGIDLWQGASEPSEPQPAGQKYPVFIATDGGRYRVTRDGQEVSAHTQIHTAKTSAAKEKLTHPQGDVEIQYDFAIRVELKSL